MKKEKNFNNINNLINALKQCGYDVNVWWDAEWDCTDHKSHHGIEVSIDVYDGDGECYFFIFNQNGKRINSCLEGDL